MGEIIFKCFLLIYGIYYFLKTVLTDTSITTKMYPLIISSFFIILIGILVYQTIIKYVEYLKDNESKDMPIFSRESLKLWVTFLGGPLLIALTLLINYWIAIIIALPLISFILDDMKFKLTTLIFLPLGMVLIVYLVFILFLNVRMPVGF